MQLLINQNKWCQWAAKVGLWKRIAATVFLTSTVVVMWYFFVRIPFFWYKKSLSQALAVCEQKEACRTLLQDQIAQLEARYRELSVGPVGASQPNSRTECVLKVSKLAQDSGLKIESCTIQSQSDQDRHTFQLIACGGFDGLIRFLSYLKSANNSFKCRELIVEKKDDQLVISSIFHLGYGQAA